MDQEQDQVKCENCNKAMKFEKFMKHIEKCVKIQCNLSEVQKKALEYCKKKSKIFSKQTEKNVIIRWHENNWDVNLIEAIRNHIQNCDIIIHFNFNNLVGYFGTDDHYKNLYEVRGDCPSRTSWENNLFNSLYKDATAYEKVKYGCINLYKSRHGVASAVRYGNSYFILHEEVKKRSSFVCGDSIRLQKHLADFENFNQLLLYLPKNVIENIIKIVLGVPIQEDNYEYVEVQIHGDVLWKRDIKKVMINKSHIADVRVGSVSMPWELI
jgi:hypothetical protein